MSDAVPIYWLSSNDRGEHASAREATTASGAMRHRCAARRAGASSAANATDVPIYLQYPSAPKKEPRRKRPAWCLRLASVVLVLTFWLLFWYFGMRSDVGRGSAVGAKSTGSNNVIPNNPPNASSLERALPENESKPPVSDAKTKYPRVENNGTVNPDDLRFIAYSDGGRGQGVGNIMLGLLMAIDLGHEFNRTVCIEGWRPFHVAFQPHPDQERLCRPGLLEGETKEAHLWNMKPSMSVERMREIVASDVKIVEFTGNSGLGAPFYKPEIYREYFVPTKALQETLPWKEPPECVVQLRIGDGYWDVRRGLDEATLQMMEKELDKDCYLVTNHFDWYARFEKVGWGHPPWTSVWRHQGSSSDKLELWSDWYTVMRAKRVYHTQSGFSESAAQAGGCISRKITGINNETGTLVMEYDGPWRAEYEKRAGLTLKTERMGIWEMVRKAISMHDPNI